MLDFSPPPDRKSLKSTDPRGGINESVYVDLNGTKQRINIYGKNKNNPVLLYLHGGPGSATSEIDYIWTRIKIEVLMSGTGRRFE